MTTYPSITQTNLELTPMQVKWKGPGAGSYIDLGATLGNVVVTAKYTKADIKADQFGETILDRRVKGIEINVATELAEIKNFDIWKVIYPHATKLVTGGTAIQFETKIGDKDTDYVGQLLLHPLSENSSSETYDYLFYSAIATAESSVTYGPTEQARLKITWTILPDFTVTPARFFRFGDKDVT